MLKTIITSEQLHADIEMFAKTVAVKGKKLCVYGIPKNGTIIAQMMARARPKDFTAVFKPHLAHIFVDDLIDSGRTAQKYINKYHRPVHVIYSKQSKITLPAKSVSGWIVFPWEDDPLSRQSETDAVARLIEMTGEDITRDGLKETPQRYVRAFEELTSGYNMNVRLTTFEKETFDQIVCLKDIPFHSLCEHHILPFHGKAHVAYIPGEKIIGISKLARLVDKYSKRLQNQERIGEEIVWELEQALQPAAVGVVIEAVHLCCSSRGVAKQGMTMVTSKLTGLFRDADSPARLEFLHLIGK